MYVVWFLKIVSLGFMVILFLLIVVKLFAQILNNWVNKKSIIWVERIEKYLIREYTMFLFEKMFILIRIEGK